MKAKDRINFEQRETLESFQPLPKRQKLSMVKSQTMEGSNLFNASLIENTFEKKDSLNIEDLETLYKNNYNRTNFKGSKLTTFDNSNHFQKDDISHIKSNSLMSKDVRKSNTVSFRNSPFFSNGCS